MVYFYIIQLFCPFTDSVLTSLNTVFSNSHARAHTHKHKHINTHQTLHTRRETEDRGVKEEKRSGGLYLKMAAFMCMSDELVGKSNKQIRGKSSLYY